MKRKRYRNGDEITLPGGCDSCRPTMINGMLCHESGCPDAWRDKTCECFECGASVKPKEKQHTYYCRSCLHDLRYA